MGVEILHFLLWAEPEGQECSMCDSKEAEDDYHSNG